MAKNKRTMDTIFDGLKDIDDSYYHQPPEHN